MKNRIFSALLALSLFCAAIPYASAATMDSHAGAVTTRSDPVNVRSSPTTAAPVVSTVNKGSHITLISRNGSWWRVEYGKNQFGYCHANYITPIEGAPAKVTAYALNIRSGRGTAFPIQGVLSHNEVVIILNTQNGWSRILYHGTKTGYVSAKYLSSGMNTPPQGTALSPISLNVPSFKQYDSRWANTTIGTSGKTFSQIGCATTAIAMVESYRTGKTIYPSTMAKNLRYTPDGSVYWPTYYQVSTSSNAYLQKLYDLLKSGKPVLFGGKNAYGKQHWVVITGFTGGSLSPDAFAILDPGSESRTNLQQFLNTYPIFYKYFSY